MLDTFDTSGSCEAMLEQFRATNAFVSLLSDEHAQLPTRLGTWRVIELVAHIGASLEFVRAAIRTTAAGPADSPLHWYRYVDEFAAVIDEETRARSAVGWSAVRDAMANRLVEVTDLLATEDLTRVVVVGNDRMTLEGVCTTRCVEGVLHTLDLADATSMECHLAAGAVDIVRRFVEVADNGHRLVRAGL